MSGWVRRLVAPLRGSLLVRILCALVAVLVVATLLTLAVDSRLTRAQLAAQAQDLLRRDLDAIRTLLSEEQTALGTVLRNGAQTLQVLDLDNPARRAALTAEIGRLRRDAGLDALVAVDGSGRVVASAGEPLDEETLPRPAAVGHAELLVRTRDGRVVRAASTPVAVRPEPLQLIGGHLFDDALAFRLRGLVQHDVLLVAGDRLVGDTLRHPVVEPPALVAGASVARPQEIVVEGTPSLVGYAPLPDFGGTAVVGVVLPEPLAALDRSLTNVRALALGLLAGLVLLLGWGLFRLLTRPLDQLARTAREIAEGNLDTSFQVNSTDEIGDLARSLEHMRHSLREQLAINRAQSDALQQSAERIVSASDEERRRLASDLHDGIQQQLVMLSMQAGLARATVQHDPQRAGELTERLAAEIDTIIERLRETSQAIYPSILTDRGLQGALFSLAAKSPVPVALHCDPDPLPRLDPHLEAQAYFVVSEAVTNALKHGECDTIDVSVWLQPSTLVLQVTDDGCGFAPGGSGPVPEGVSRWQGGLTHLEDRITALRGGMGVHSAPGRGTTVIAELPLSVRRALEEEQDGGDPAVEVVGVAEPQLGEDGAAVLFDGLGGDEQPVGDGGVVLARGHQGQDLKLARREPGEP